MILRRISIIVLCALSLLTHTQIIFSATAFNYRTHGVFGSLAIAAAACTVFAVSSAYKTYLLSSDIHDQAETLAGIVSANKMAQALDAKPGNAFLLQQHVQSLYKTQDADDRVAALKKLRLLNQSYGKKIVSLVGTIDAFIKSKQDSTIKPIQDTVQELYRDIEENIREKESQKLRAIVIACVNSVVAFGSGLGVLFYSRIA